MRGSFGKLFCSTRRTVIVLAVFCFAAIGGGLAVGAWLALRPTTNPFPAGLQRSAKFPLYYPSKLPDGFSIDQKSISGNNEAVLYSIVSKDSTILVSIQAKPQDKSIDLEKFYKQKLAQTERKQIPLGTATIGNLDNSTFASLTTDKSWIILTADKQNSQTKDQMISVLASMRSN